MYERELHIAVAAVREAAELCRNIQGTMEASVLEKTDRSPVTIADFGSQALVCSRLRDAFPGDAIIAEEDASVLREDKSNLLRERVVRQVQKLRTDARAPEILDWVDLGGDKTFSVRFWTLDPIDGTKGYLRGDQYAVALALIVSGKLTVSAVACPNLSLEQMKGDSGLLMAAVAGGGTRMYRLSDLKDLGMARVSQMSDPEQLTICESVEESHTSHAGSVLVAQRMGISSASLRMDSQAKYAVVASGNAEIYLRLPSDRRYVENIWDHAAGSLLVEEAGGRVTDIDGNDLDFSLGFQLVENRGVVVSNGVVHETLLEAVHGVGL